MFNRQSLGVIAIVGTLVGASVAAGAQNASPAPQTAASVAPMAPGAGHHRGGRMGRALRELNLSTAQQGQVKQIMTSYRSSRTSANPETRAQLMSAIQGVLTPAQRTQFQTAMARHRRADTTMPAATPSP